MPTTPWGAIIQGGLGAIQAVAGGIRAKKSEKALEKMQSPTYQQNPSIMDYYNKALTRYNVNPYESSMYKQQMQGANRNLATGIGALQDRRSGLAGVSQLVGLTNDSALKANVAAENEQSRRFGQLGGATSMKAGEDRMAFNVNQVQPFERKYNLMAAKASGGNKVMGAGLSNIFGAGQSFDQRNQLKDYYNSLNQGTTGASAQASGEVGLGSNIKKALWNTRNILGH